MLVEVRMPIRPGAGSAYEKVERRAGDWAVASAGAYLVLDGDTRHRRRHRAGRGRRRSRLRPGRRGVPARQGSHRRHDRRGRPTGRRVQQPQRRSTRPGHLQEAPRRRTHPSASLRRAAARATGKGSDMQVQHHRQRCRAHRRGRAATAARALSPRHVAAHRNPLGMRHLAVRNVRGLAGRGAGEDLHRAGRDGRRAPGAHRRGPRGWRQARPGAGGLHERTRPAVRVLHARA